MAKRLAITISGAVSLGSYEAGVLYEVLEAIAIHNTDQNTSDAEKIFVDVVTGASAGGMCATVLAHKLLYDGASLRDPAKNALHDPWIVDVSLAGLLNQGPTEPSTKSLFSSDLIEAISRKYITSRYQNGAPPQPAPHPALDPSRPLYLGLALSNLDGVDYSRSLLTGGKFTYTRYQDEFRRSYTTAPAHDTLDTWEEARNVAVACGAFPFAFRVKGLSRKVSDYVPVPADFPQLGMRFAYTDGGVFQNEPLGMAKDFVDEIDRHVDTDSRFYLFIAPGARNSTIAAQGDLVTEDNATFFVTAKSLLGAIFNQARFHDWIMAEKVNQRVSLFNRRALDLQNSLLNGRISAAAVNSASTLYLSHLLQVNPQLTEALVESETARLRSQFASQYQELAGAEVAPGAADAWLRSILVLELAADLQATDEMNILGITASETELAGSPLLAFAGFFDQGIRQHDYDVGRNKAKTFIAGQNASSAAFKLGPFRYNPGASVPLDPAYNNFDVTKLSADEREDLKDRLLDRINTLLAQAGMSWVVRHAIISFYIKSKIDELLKLDD